MNMMNFTLPIQSNLRLKTKHHQAPEPEEDADQGGNQDQRQDIAFFPLLFFLMLQIRFHLLIP